jgi:hypothetical protein
MNKQFIKDFFTKPEVEVAVKKHNFDLVYKLFQEKLESIHGPYYNISSLTSFFLSCNINPLDYLTKIPYNYAYGLGFKSIIIPDNISIIVNHAFNDCDKLATLVISNSVKKIGMGAFNGCWSLKDINIPDSVTDIDIYTFSNCISLTHITLSKSLTEIKMGVFSHCIKLDNVIVPPSVVNIGALAFSDCVALKHISIPKTCKVVDDAFRGCHNATLEYY